MFLNLGGDTVVSEKDIIGIFDMDKLTVFKVNRNYLSNAEKKGRIITVTKTLPKSFVICVENNKEKTYISPLLPATLAKRGEGNAQ